MELGNDEDGDAEDGIQCDSKYLESDDPPIFAFKLGNGLEVEASILYVVTHLMVFLIAVKLLYFEEIEALRVLI